MYFRSGASKTQTTLVQAAASENFDNHLERLSTIGRDDDPKRVRERRFIVDG